MTDFSIFDSEKLRKLNGITMTTREAQLGDFLATVLEFLSGTGDLSEEQSTSKAKVAETTKKVVPTVSESDATTIKQLVSDYNDLLNALKNVGVIK